MTVLEINKKLWPIPQTWDELTPKQSQRVMMVLCSDYTADQARLCILRIISGCGYYHFIRQQIRSMAAIYDALHLADFVFTTPAMFKQPMPYYKGLYAPADNFDNLRMNEFAYAQNYYEAYQSNPQDLAALDGLVATLYRPRGGVDDADVREPFREVPMKLRIARVKGWHFYRKELVFFWYASCLKSLMDANADVFTGDGEPALHGIISVMRNVAKEGTYGDFEKVEMMYVKMLFLELRESKQEADRMDKS